MRSFAYSIFVCFRINFVYRSLAERLEELEQSVAADVNLYEVPVLRGTCTVSEATKGL